MKMDYNFSEPFRVRYAEIDGQRIVFNSHYLTYMDHALFSYFRHLLSDDLNFLYEENMFEHVLTHLEMDFMGSGGLDDILEVYVKITRLGTTSFDVNFLIRKQGEDTDLIKAAARYVCISLNPKKSKKIPDAVRNKIIFFEKL